MDSPLYSVKRLPMNQTGRDFIVGDVHGTFDLLEQALIDIDFDVNRDRLFSVGDVIDRGLRSYRCLEFLQLPYVHTVRGNHEDMLLNLYAKGTPSPAQLQRATGLNGLDWWQQVSPGRRTAILEALRALPLVIEVDTVRGSVGIVHAEVPPGLTWQQFCACIEAGEPGVVESALWGRSRIRQGDVSGVPGIGRLFVGHTPHHGGPSQYGNTYAVDTGAVFGAEQGQAGFRLTVADVITSTESLTQRREAELLDLRVVQGAGTFGRYVASVRP